MGVLQALEAIKVLTSKPPTHSSSSGEEEAVRPTLLIFSAYNSPQFRSVRLRSRRADCAACSSRATITPNSLTSGSLDYIAFCGATAPVNLLPPEHRVSATDFSRLPRDGSNVLIDVRDEVQYAICALRGSVNVPWTGSAESWLEKAGANGLSFDDGRDFYVMCRFGNDSQLAARAALQQLEGAGMAMVKDITGGFQNWRAEVDPSWPDY